MIEWQKNIKFISVYTSKMVFTYYLYNDIIIPQLEYYNDDDDGGESFNLKTFHREYQTIYICINIYIYSLDTTLHDTRNIVWILNIIIYTHVVSYVYNT